ncbi:hypothetical protein V2K27_22680 [Pseudomonas alliivorans]|nr:hypothetical protein [Pseudomonas alliivorans]MEE4860985.1 hypothetical protein [Pseudomonas alliivorans]MEE4876134.1 hypothetical protein [Pseudomonas alliivorans]MEE4906833.1 hypothetical protein [Pseudomonas alliivorans]
MDALAKELVGCRANSDPVACRGGVQDKYQGLNDSKTGAGLYGCKALGESACNDQYTAAKSGSAQVDSLLGSLALNADEKDVLAHFQDLNHGDERVAHHAWLESSWIESGVAGGVLTSGAAMLTTAERAAATTAAGAKEVAGVPKSPNLTSAITDAEAGTSGLPKLGSLKGEPELPPKNASPDMVRSIERQNEASKKLAQAGFDVEQLANTGRKGGNPDLRINGDLADVFSPRTNSPISVLMTVTEKVEKQASSVVVNLADSPLTFAEIEKALLSRPVEGLKKLYLMKNNEFRVVEASK